MKKLTLAAILIVLTLCSTTVFADSSFGFINIEQILKQSVKLKTIENNFSTYQQQVVGDFDRAKIGMSDSDAQIAAAGYQEDILMHEQMAASRIDANVRAAIKIVAKKLKLDVVLSTATSFYGGRDITDEVIKTLDAGQD